jgi:hypothetical protein
MSQSVLHSCDYVDLVVVVDKKESGGELVPGKIRETGRFERCRYK